MYFYSICTQWTGTIAWCNNFILQATGIFEREEDLLRRIEALGGDVTSQKEALAKQRQRVELMGQYLQQ